METLNLHPAYVSSRDISGNNAVTFGFFSFQKGKEEEKEKKITDEY